MSYRYLVLGAGMQGVAAAYDLATHGDADSVILGDNNPDAAKAGANRINSLLKQDIVKPSTVDAADSEGLVRLLTNFDGLLSAVPYKFNLDLTKIAILTRTNMVDMGGHTGVVRKQLEMKSDVRQAGISIIPDCGMGPGMNITLALYAISLLDKTDELKIYDGGLPQDPKPPWNYNLFFHINGLINEYDGEAYYLREGKVTQVPALTECEEIEIPPLGRLEAFVTSGGLSTMPWTFEKELKTLENKTLRYSGHCQIFQSYKRLGLFREDPIEINDQKIVPREFLFRLLEPQLYHPEAKDICIIHIRANGTRQGKPARATIHLVDRFDDKTKFRAMEKLTGWHAAIVLELAVKGEINKGVIPIEKALSGERFVELMPKRGWKIEELVEFQPL